MSLQTDNFNRADNSVLGANWTQVGGFIGTTSNQALCSSNANSFAYWSATSFTGDHFSQVTTPAVASGYGAAVVRFQNIGGGQGYMLASRQDDGHVHLYPISGGTAGSSLHDYGAIATNGQVLYLSAVGSLLTAKRNGTTLGTVTDTAYTGGAPGLWMFLTNATLDDWSGDDVSSGATRGLFRTPALSGVGGGGSFFRDPLQAPMARRGDLYVPDRMAA